MSKKSKKLKKNSEKRLVNKLLAITAVIDLVLKVIDLIEKMLN